MTFSFDVSFTSFDNMFVDPQTLNLPAQSLRPVFLDDIPQHVVNYVDGSESKSDSNRSRRQKVDKNRVEKRSQTFAKPAKPVKFVKFVKRRYAQTGRYAKKNTYVQNETTRSVLRFSHVEISKVKYFLD